MRYDELVPDDTSDTQAPAPKNYLTVADAAASLGIHPSTLRNAIREGRLPAINFLGRLAIDPDDLEEYRQRTRPNGGEKPRGRPRKP